MVGLLHISEIPASEHAKPCLASNCIIISNSSVIEYVKMKCRVFIFVRLLETWTTWYVYHYWAYCTSPGW
jgi:hypothetical protein